VIIRSIEVKGWRCFANKARLGPLSEGLNVIYGPNGTGKSTLFQAMVRGLLDNYGVGGEEAQTLRPWGRALAPTVLVEFRDGGNEYRISKQFLDRPSSLLESFDRGAFTALAENEKADEQVRRMLRATGRGRGLADVENWGLAQVLWTLQGDLKLVNVTHDVIADIRTMLGAHFAGPRGGRLEQRIEGIYAEYFDKRGAPRKGQHAPAAVGLAANLAAAKERLTQAREVLNDFEDRALALDGIRAERAQISRDITASTTALAAARKQAGEYHALSLERERRAGQLRGAEAEYQRVFQQIETIRAAAAQVDGNRREIEQLEASLPPLRRAEEEARAEAQRRLATLENARGRQAAVVRAREEADLAGQYDNGSQAIGELSRKLEQVRTAAEPIAALRRERDALIAPDATALKAIRKTFKSRDDAQLKLEAALMQIEIEPARDAAVTVLEGEKPGAFALRAGVAETFHGWPAVVLDIEGFGRVRARGSAENVEELRAERNKAAAKLTRLTEPFGTADLETLEALSERATTLENEIARHEAGLTATLAGKTADALTAEHAKWEIVIAGIEAKQPAWKTEPPDAGALQRSAAELNREVQAEIAAAERLWTAAQELASSTQGASQAEGLLLDAARKALTDGEHQLQTLRSDRKTDAERDGERIAAARESDAARASLAEIEGQLANFAGDPADEVRSLENQLTRMADLEREALKRENLAEGALSKDAAQGPYRGVAIAEEEVGAITPRLARELARMEAVKLLSQTVMDCRTKAVAAVAAPVESVASSLLHRIAGGRFGRIRLGETLLPENLLASGPEEPVPVVLGDASGGEREQVFFATRLALAEVLAREKRQLVLLDDVLTATDTARMARIMRVLEESAEKLQIVILTCHPERYVALQGAKFFDMQEVAMARHAAAQ
jgi:energy-coupling factor transporter ATP-binding protein EcfA2